MRLCLASALALAAAAAGAEPGTVAECRTEHPDDPSAYVRCLETALAERDDEPPVNQLPDAPPDADRADFGAEQLPPPEEELAVKIVSATYDARGLGTFRMQDGQVWRETTKSPERRRLAPGRQYTARIVRGTVGGYRMYVDGVRRMKTVERIE